MIAKPSNKTGAPSWFDPNLEKTRSIPPMAADALAPCTTRPWATMVLNLQVKWIFVCHRIKFQLPSPFQGWQSIQNANIHLSGLPAINLTRQGLITYIYLQWCRASSLEWSIFAYWSFESMTSIPCWHCGLPLYGGPIQWRTTPTHWPRFLMSNKIG